MIVVDVNVLVAAHMAEHPRHERARSFLTHSLGSDTVIIPDTVWSGFLRAVTNSRIFSPPSPLAEAIGFVRSVAAAPGYRHVAGLTDGIEPLLRTALDAEASANLIPDAYLAAFALDNGCAVATFDRDFRRFDGLQLITP